MSYQSNYYELIIKGKNMSGETPMDPQELIQNRADSIKVSGEQEAPSGVAFGESKNVIKNFTESDQRISNAEFGVDNAQHALKRVGAGEFNTKLGTWILDSMQKFVNWRTRRETTLAVKDREKVSNKRQKAKERRERIKGYQEGRLLHKANKERTKIDSSDTLSIYNPIKLLAEANYVPVEALKASWNEAWANKYNDQAHKHAEKGREFRDVWGKKLKKFAEQLRENSSQKTEVARAALEGPAGENKDQVSEMQAKLDQARLEAEMAKAELKRLQEAKFIQPAAAAVTQGMEAAGINGQKAADATEFMATTSADYLAGNQPK